MIDDCSRLTATALEGSVSDVDSVHHRVALRGRRILRGRHVVRSSRRRKGRELSVRVAVNCAIAARGVSGTARGLQFLLDALDARPGVSVQELWPHRRMRSSRVWNAWAQASWDLRGAALTGADADVLVSACNIGRGLRRQRHVLVIVDTMALDNPELFDRGFAAYARALVGMSVRAASVIVVPSSYTERCVRDHWPDAPPTVVARFPFLVTGRMGPSPDDRGRILMVGATEVHKRHVLGIQAVHAAREISGEALSLTIVGPAGRAEESVGTEIQRADPDGTWITRLENVPSDVLEREYDRAWLLLQPSQCEGYGLPVGEAASRGIPTVHSGNGSLNEIAPGAVQQADEVSAYSAAVVGLLDPGAHASAAHAAIDTVQHLTRDAYAQAVGTALGAGDD